MDVSARRVLPACNTLRADRVSSEAIEIVGIWIEIGITCQDLAPMVDKKLVRGSARWNSGLEDPVPIRLPDKLQTRAATQYRLFVRVIGNAQRSVCSRDVKRLRKFVGARP